MRSTTRHVFVALVLVFCLTLVAGSAQAAHEVYMTINGTKPGTFTSQRIPCLKFSYEPTSSRDSATGQASGKRRHEEIVVTKEWGPASPALFRAMNTNEVLREVKFEFVRPTPGKGDQVYKTLRLSNATVASIRRFADKGTRELEEVTFAFDREKLEPGGADGQPVPLERWMTIPK
jgi:type VI secretion system secreted protein Hcp